MPTFTNVKQTDLKQLLKHGFHYIETKSQYETARMQSLNPKATIILYTSNKLVLQASVDNVKLIKMLFRRLNIGKEVKEIQKKQIKGTTIGSDESLKGDTFGGITVAAVKTTEKTRLSLELLGVQDSKNLEDKKIPDYAKEVKRIVGQSNYKIKNIYPEEYNKHKQTELLNALHLQTALELGKGTHIIDKYPGCNVGDIRETKAEQKYVCVAAASVLARDEALKQIRELSNQLNIEIPKGSTHVKKALKELIKSKKDPSRFVKMHFSNVKELI